MLGLSRLEREVTSRGLRVRTDITAANTARRTLIASVRAELAKPKTLLILFATGLGVGWLRGLGGSRERQEDDDADEVAEKTGRLAKAMAAVMAGVRIYEQTRRATGFVERYTADARQSRSAPPGPSAAEPREH